MHFLNTVAKNVETYIEQKKNVETYTEQEEYKSLHCGTHESFSLGPVLRLFQLTSSVHLLLSSHVTL